MSRVLVPNGSKTLFHPEAHLATHRRPTNPMAAVAYLRVSTDEQSLGMDAQRDAIQAWASRQGIEIVAWCEDVGLSGGLELPKRPGMLAALSQVRDQRAGNLVAHKADRIARDVFTASTIRRELRRAGAVLSLVEGISGNDPFAVMAQTVADAAAELERKLIGARTRAALQVKRGKGERVGSIPYGYRLKPDGIHLEPHPEEHSVLVRVLELRRAGLGGRKIAATLTKVGFRPRGTAWNPGNLQVMADRWLAAELPLDLKEGLERKTARKKNSAIVMTVVVDEFTPPTPLSKMSAVAIRMLE